MALGTNQFTDTDLDVMIPEVWGEKINDYFKEQLVMASFFTDRSDELVGGGDVIHTPNMTAMSANTKTNGSQVTLNSPTETKVDLTVDTWIEVSFMIEDREATQVKQSYNLQRRYAENAAFEVGQEVEIAISKLFSGFSTAVGASTTNLADSDILQAIATLEANKVPGVHSGDVAFFLHPYTWYRQVGSIDKFSLAVNAPVNDPVSKNPMRTLYGIPVKVTPNTQYINSTSGRWQALAHKDAIHWARLSLPAVGRTSMVGAAGVRVQTNYIPEYLGHLTTADICYGVIENRDGAGVCIKTHATKA